MRKYRHLFFDLDNTLYDFTTNSKLALYDTVDQLGILAQLPSFDEFYSIYSQVNDQLWADYRNRKVTKEILRQLRFELSLKPFDVQVALQPIEIDDKYLEIMPSKSELFPNTIEVLNELKHRGYQMHIITNGFKEVQFEKMKQTGLTPFFKNVYISEVLKSPKPETFIFEYAIKSSNARKKESVMIGDSWESDIIGAQNIGIDQIFFNPDNISIDFDTNKKPTHSVQMLTELLQIL